MKEKDNAKMVKDLKRQRNLRIRIFGDLIRRGKKIGIRAND